MRQISFTKFSFVDERKAECHSSELSTCRYISTLNKYQNIKDSLSHAHGNEYIEPEYNQSPAIASMHSFEWKNGTECLW